MNRAEIVEIVNAVQPGETTEIPHYDLTVAMYDDDADAVDGTMQYTRKFVSKIAEGRNVTIKYSDNSNSWIVRSTIPDQKDVLVILTQLQKDLELVI